MTTRDCRLVEEALKSLLKTRMNINNADSNKLSSLLEWVHLSQRVRKEARRRIKRWQKLAYGEGKKLTVAKDSIQQLRRLHRSTSLKRSLEQLEDEAETRRQKNWQSGINVQKKTGIR